MNDRTNDRTNERTNYEQVDERSNERPNNPCAFVVLVWEWEWRRSELPLNSLGWLEGRFLPSIYRQGGGGVRGRRQGLVGDKHVLVMYK
jgi:hypothetical protein